MEDVRNKLLLQMTGQEFVDLLGLALDEFARNLNQSPIVEKTGQPKEKMGGKHYIYGLKGLCKLLGCSYSTAYRIKRSGILNAATSQIRRTIVFDADMVLEIVNLDKKNILRKRR